MKTKVTQTSLEAYDALKPEKEPTQTEKVYNYLKEKGKITINQAHRALNIFPSTISARLNNLSKQGRAIRTEERIVDPITGMSNNLWRVI